MGDIDFAWSIKNESFSSTMTFELYRILIEKKSIIIFDVEIELL